MSVLAQSAPISLTQSLNDERFVQNGMRGGGRREKGGDYYYPVTDRNQRKKTALKWSTHSRPKTRLSIDRSIDQTIFSFTGSIVSYSFPLLFDSPPLQTYTHSAHWFITRISICDLLLEYRLARVVAVNRRILSHFIGNESDRRGSSHLFFSPVLPTFSPSSSLIPLHSVGLSLYLGHHKTRGEGYSNLWTEI